MIFFHQHNKKQRSFKILVTGSRGKSSVVRLLHSCFVGLGYQAYGRITGVLPRQLTPYGEEVILRGSNPHVAEMDWWLKQLPSNKDAIIMENSAIAPELQNLASRWLKPDLVVLTNIRPDHIESWGPGSRHAAKALIKGIPFKSRVVLPKDVFSEPYVEKALKQKKCRMILADEYEDLSKTFFLCQNLGLALKACEAFELDKTICLESMTELKPDLADFRIKQINKAQLAVGFAINDLLSTQKAFNSLGWTQEKTSLIYNHRKDRPQRFKDFYPFLNQNWQKILVIGDPVKGLTQNMEYVPLKNLNDFKKILNPKRQYFGLGNLLGLPLSLLATDTKTKNDSKPFSNHSLKKSRKAIFLKNLWPFKPNLSFWHEQRSK